MKDYLIKKLAIIYKMHEYDLNPEKMKYIILCLNKKVDIETLNKKTIDLFTNQIEAGYFGILYKQPTCISYMFSKFISENRSLLSDNTKYQSFDSIMKKDWDGR